MQGSIKKEEDIETAKIESVYDKTSWYWDSIIHRLVYGRAYLRLFERLSISGVLTSNGKPLKILDCGIGAGLFSAAAIKAISGIGELYGVDISQNLIELAAKNLAGCGAGINLRHESFYPLKFPDGAMDMVITALTLEHSPDPLEMIREMARVVRPGGNVVVVTTRSYAPDFLFRVLFKYSPMEHGKMIKWMNDAGLCNVSYHSLGGVARLFGMAFTGEKRNN